MSTIAKDIAALSPAQRALLELRLKKKRAQLQTAQPDPIRRQSRQSPVFPLSFAQQRLWFLDQLTPGNVAYNLPAAFRLTGRLQVQALEQAYNEIIQRHEILRTVFPTEADPPVQVILPSLKISLVVMSLEDLPAAQQQARIEQLATHEAHQPFDLAHGPLVRASVLQLNAEEHVVLFTLHHIVSDGWSMGVLMHEVASLYDACVQGRSSPLPELSIQYADFAYWQRNWLQGHVLEKQLNYWKKQLAGAPSTLELPTDYPRPATQSYQGAIHTFAISPSVSARLKAVTQAADATLYMTLLAVFGMLLSRYSRQKDIVIGSPVANRHLAQTEPLIGFFVNTLVLRLQLDNNPTFSDVLSQVKTTALQAYDHQDIPFEQLVDALQPVRDLSYSPLFQVLFNLQNIPMHSLQLSNLQISPIELSQTTSKFDLTVFMEEQADGLQAIIEYNTDLFALPTITRMAGHLTQLLHAVAQDPTQPIESLSLLTEAERHQLTVWNTTHIEYADYTGSTGSTDSTDGRCIHEWFEYQVQACPDAIALVYDGHCLSYWAVNRQANQLADYLRRNGVQPDSLVGICAERCLGMVIGLLAILKAGGAYVPFDPSYPHERLASMLGDMTLSVLLTQQHLVDDQRIPPIDASVQLVCLDTQLPVYWRDAPYQGENLPRTVTPQNLAYAIFTSGSTGKPKGVMNTHAAIRNRLLWMQDAYHLTPDDTVVQKTPYSFDVSVWEFFWPLMYGARLVIAKPGGHQDSSYLAALMAEEQVTTLHFVPSMLHAFLEEPGLVQCTQVRQVFCSGEALTYSLQQKFFRHFSAELHNLYGPTEAAVDVTFWPCEPETGRKIVPIGRPIANTQIHILDDRLQPVPVGVAGELHIGGINVARGYLQRPTLTAEKFIPDANHPDPAAVGARVYKTGDLARWLGDGTLEYLDRIDNQVKIRGMRIELGEIEAALLQHPDLKDAAVAVYEDAAGHKRLAAYFVPAGVAQASRLERVEQLEPNEPNEPNKPETHFIEEVRIFLKTRLPEHMIPAFFVALEALPLSTNGKLDRRSLPAPDLSGLQRPDQYTAPRTAQERLLVTIWQEVLQLDQVGIHDNFFALGGDSILNIQVVSRAKKAGLELSPKLLFQHQTIAELAVAIPTTRRLQVDQGIVTGPLPLTPIQHWFFEHHGQAPEHFNQAVLLEVVHDWDDLDNLHDSDAIDPSLLTQALDHLSRHHDALRLRFTSVGETWQADHAEVGTPVPVEVIDLSELPAGDQAAAFAAAVDQQHTRLQLETGNLARLAVLRSGPDTPYRVLIILHHLIVDGISWRIMLEDLATLYTQLRNGQAPSLPPKTSAYKHWAEQLVCYAQTESVQAERTYWQSLAWERARGLPQDYQPAAGANVNIVSSCDVVTQSLSEEETRALLTEVPSAYNTQINDVLLAAVAMSVADWSGQPLTLVDLEGHGREDIFDTLDVSRTVGWFTSVYPVLLECVWVPGQDPGQQLRAVKEYLHTIPCHGLNYGVLRYMCQDAAMQALPQPDILFNYLGQLDAISQQSGLSGLFRPAPESSGLARHPDHVRRHLLEIAGFVSHGELHLDWTYSTKLHKRTSIEILATRFMTALQTLIAHCQSPHAGGYTPSDFPDITCDQESLENVLSIVHAHNSTDSGQRHKNIEGIYPLSPSQQGMLVESLALAQAGLHIEQTVWQFHAALQLDAFQQAWQTLLDRHAMLRTAFVWPEMDEMDEPVQVVLQHTHLPIHYQDVSHLTPSEQRDMIETYVHDDRIQGFVLAKAPLMRLSVWQLGDSHYQLAWSHHHIIMDGWCTALVQKELLEIYTQRAQGRADQLPPVQPYRDYIRWLKKQDLGQAEAFWRHALQGFRTPTQLGIESPALDVPTSSSALAQEHAVLSVEETQRLQRLVREHTLTLGQLVQGVWAVLLSRYSSEDDVVFGVTISGRPADLPGVESIIGLFINTVPFRCRVRPESPLWTWLHDIHTQQHEMHAHIYCSAGQIQQWSEVPGGTPLYDSILVFQNYPTQPAGLELPDTGPGKSGESQITQIMQDESSGARTHYALTFIVSPEPGLEIRTVSDPVRLVPSEVAQMRQHMLRLLKHIATSPTSSVQALLDLIPEQQIPRLHPPPSRHQPYVAPRDSVEWQLVQLWEALLDKQPIGVTDNFFELGGHSLLAVSLMSQIHQQFGKRLALASLFQTGTIEKLAGILRQHPQASQASQASTFASLVTIHPQRPDSTQLPYVCVHPGGGTVLCYYELAARLGKDSPVYAFQALGIEAGQSPLDTVEAIAQHYLNELVQVQPTGPYVLVGWSFGAVVVYEMAQRLQAQGQDIALLALLDAYVPSVLPAENWHKDSASLLTEIFSQDIPLSLEPLCQLDLEDQLAWVLDKASGTGVFPPDFTLSDALRAWQVFMAHRKAEQNYTPQPYQGHLTLFISDQRVDEPDQTLGWGLLASEGVSVRRVPGNHQEILRAPQVQVLADILADVLAQKMFAGLTSYVRP